MAHADRKKQYSFLFEQTTVVPNHDIKILEESKVNGNSKVAFACRLQESEVVNNNKRKYSNIVCESIVQQLAPKAQNRSLFMEINKMVSY